MEYDPEQIELLIQKVASTLGSRLEGLLEPLLVDLRNALEAEEYQNTTSGNNFDPHLGKIKEEMTPIEVELVEGSGLPLKTVREILEVT